MRSATNNYATFAIISLLVILLTSFWYLSTSTAAILTFQARAMREKGELEAAHQALDQAFKLARLDGSRRLLAQIAQLNTDLKRPDHAIESYEELFRTGRPSSLDQAKELLILYRNSQRYADAINFISRNDIQELFGDALEVDLLAFHIDNGSYDLAIKIIEKKIGTCLNLLTCTLENRNGIILELKLKRAEILSWDKRFEESLKAYQELLKINLDGIAIHERIAEVLAWKNDFSGAADALSEIIKMKPQDLDIRTRQVYYLFWAKRFQDAEQIINSSPDILKNDPTLIQFSVDHDLENSNFKEAEIQLREALASSQNDTNEILQNLRLKLAEILSWQGKYEDSLKEYEILLIKNPENIQIRRSYATVLSWAGQHRQSAIELKKTLRARD